MKKILVTILALVISLSMFGCAKAVKEEMPAPAATETAQPEVPAQEVPTAEVQ